MNSMVVIGVLKTMYRDYSDNLLSVYLRDQSRLDNGLKELSQKYLEEYETMRQDKELGGGVRLERVFH